MNKIIQDENTCNHRRLVLKTVVGATAGTLGMLSLGMSKIAYAAAITKKERDKMTPDEIIHRLKEGNERFRHGKLKMHDYLAQKQSSVSGQFPTAIMLSCIDSRVPAEIIFDTGIGEAFNTRVAGNVVNNDILGSIEFACAVAGAKVIVVMGHTSCGAIKGAIDNAQMGNLTGLLEKIKPAIAATSYSGKRDTSNYVFVDAVAKTNVQLAVNHIRKESPIVNNLEKTGKVKIVGAMYSLQGGKVEFF